MGCNLFGVIPYKLSCNGTNVLIFAATDEASLSYKWAFSTFAPRCSSALLYVGHAALKYRLHIISSTSVTVCYMACNPRRYNSYGIIVQRCRGSTMYRNQRSLTFSTRRHPPPPPPALMFLPHPEQFLNTLAGLQASCQARLLEPRSHPNTPSVSSSPSTMPILPTPEDLAGLDRRIEILRRKRDDLVADKIAAAHAAAIEKAAAAAAAESTTVDSASNESRAYDDGIQGEVQEERSPRTRSSPSKRTGLSRRSNPSGGYDNPAGDELWRGRREEAAGRRGDEQEADTAQAEEVTQEIASMAGRLKESSMAINTTLRTQTRVGVVAIYLVWSR